MIAFEEDEEGCTSELVDQARLEVEGVALEEMEVFWLENVEIALLDELVVDASWLDHDVVGACIDELEVVAP